jgi:hypothetical protein
MRDEPIVLTSYDSEPVELTICARVLTLLREGPERYVDRAALLKDETEEPRTGRICGRGADAGALH